MKRAALSILLLIGFAGCQNKSERPQEDIAKVITVSAARGTVTAIVEWERYGGREAVNVDQPNNVNIPTPGERWATIRCREPYSGFCYVMFAHKAEENEK